MRILFIAALGLLAGCAANYETYVQTQENIAIANANAQAEKYKAMASIGASGSDAAKVAAMMSLALGKDEQRQVMVQGHLFIIAILMEQIYTMVNILNSIFHLAIN